MNVSFFLSFFYFYFIVRRGVFSAYGQKEAILVAILIFFFF